MSNCFFGIWQFPRCDVQGVGKHVWNILRQFLVIFKNNDVAIRYSFGVVKINQL